MWLLSAIVIHSTSLAPECSPSKHIRIHPHADVPAHTSRPYPCLAITIASQSVTQPCIPFIHICKDYNYISMVCLLSAIRCRSSSSSTPSFPERKRPRSKGLQY